MRRTAILTALMLAVTVLPAAAQQDTTATKKKDTSKDPLPLEPTRSVRIDLTEGTWISVDVSPDGRTIVFDYLGDLFSVPIEGGNATQLTSGMAFDQHPRFSPDGKQIVFASDRDGGQNIWTMTLDMRDTVQITKGKANRAESAEWTPDGNYIIASVGDFRGSALPTLKMYHVKGGGGVALTKGTPVPKAVGAAFSGDGRWIWYAQRTQPGDWTYNAQLPQYAVRVYDRDTGKSYTRVSRYGSAFSPTLSPDGRWLVYGTRHEDQTGLMLRELESGAERWLAYPVQHDDQESRGTLGVLPAMSFTPDSRHLVASYGGKIWKVPVAGGAATEVPFRVTFDQPLGPLVDFDRRIDDAPTFTVQQIRDAAPSPDGRRIAFTALDRLYVANIDGSDPRPLTPGTASEQNPAWSPDGRWIAYATWDGDAGHIRRVRSTGGKPETLTSVGGVYMEPAWSGDGRRIVAMRGQTRAFLESASPFAAYAAANEIVWLPSSGGAPTLIAPADGRSFPHFVEGDAERIYLSAGAGSLVSIRWDGTDPRTHVTVKGPTPPGSTQPVSADVVIAAPRGDQALALVNGQLYTVTVPTIGGEAPTISVADPEKASFPARRLSEIGAEFPVWGAGGRRVHYSLGNAHFIYDLDAAQLFDDSVRTAARLEARARSDSSAAEPDSAAADSTKAGAKQDQKKTYQPRESRVTITARRDIPTGSAVLRGGRIISMRGDEIIEDGEVVVRDNRIVAVGRRGSVQVPGDARVVDVTGKTIVPGFVDTHSHMWPSWGLHRSDQWIYLANLAYGVTTTRDPQTATTDVLTYADLVRTGQIVGPRIFSTGPGLFWAEGFKDLDHARKVLRRYKEYYDTHTLKMYVAGNRQQRQWIIQAARELGMMPTTEGSLNVVLNVTETFDGYSGLEHSLPIYPVYEDFVKLFAESGRTYTPTLLVAYGGPFGENYFFQTENVHDDVKLRRFTPHEELDAMTRRRPQWFMPEEHVFQDHARFAAELVKAGGRVGVGSHGQLQGLGYHWELWAVQSGGMTPHQALRAATLHGAEALGLDPDIGSIEPGKLADLVVLDRDPLEEIRNTNSVRYVMLNGRLYEGSTLDEVWPRQRKQPPLWWWGVDPKPGELPGIAPAR